MEEQNSNAYSEALAVLKLLDDEEKLEKLPIEMLEVLKAKANPEYKPVFSKDIPLEDQNLMPETLSILSWIAMKYWNEEVLAEENDIEKINVQEQNNETDIETITQEEPTLIKENVELNSEQINRTTKDEDSTLPILYKDLKWYQKIKIKIIEFFNKIFKNHNIKEKNNEEEGNTL